MIFFKDLTTYWLNFFQPFLKSRKTKIPQLTIELIDVTHNKMLGQTCFLNNENVSIKIYKDAMVSATFFSSVFIHELGHALLPASEEHSDSWYNTVASLISLCKCSKETNIPFFPISRSVSIDYI